MDSEADATLVVERELLLLQPEIRQAPERVLSFLHPDFVEYGSSGRVWDRSSITSATAGSSEPIQAMALQSKRLGPDAFLLTYTSQAGKARALRSSTWVREGGQWLLLFHQGTTVTE